MNDRELHHGAPSAMAESRRPAFQLDPLGDQRAGDLLDMPVAAWVGLAVIVALAVLAWGLVRRRRGDGTRTDAARRSVRSGSGAAAGSGPMTSTNGRAASESADAGGAPQTAVRAAAVAEALSPAEIFRRLHELAFGAERLGLPSLEAYDAVAPGIQAVLDTVATEPRYAPRRPLLLPQLLRAMRDDEVSRSELARIIARDPALTGDLLKLANGAFYRVSDRPVESIDRAVALLGTEGLRSLVATALVQPVFRLSALEFPRFPETVWDHSMRAATAAESHAAIVEDTDPFAAQLLGLIMGLGSIVVFRVALDQYTARGRAANAAVIAALLNGESALVAGRIAASWELSGRILGALQDQAPVTEMREPTSLGRSLHFGRVMGALAVLRDADRLKDDTAKASILDIGASEFQFERIWVRLTGRRDREKG
jgi:HD-like signal output (HDOD) protein